MSNHKSLVTALAVFNRNLFDAARRVGVSEEQLYDLLNGDEIFMLKIALVINDSKGPVAQKLAAMNAVCKLTYINPIINEANFPITGPAADPADMLTLTQRDLGSQNMTTAQIEAAIGLKDCRPATLADQLDYLKAKWNGLDSIVALGSHCVDPYGRRVVPYTYGGTNTRVLDLRWDNIEFGWHSDSLFLAVRK